MLVHDRRRTAREVVSGPFRGVDDGFFPDFFLRVSRGSRRARDPRETRHAGRPCVHRDLCSARRVAPRRHCFFICDRGPVDHGKPLHSKDFGDLAVHCGRNNIGDRQSAMCRPTRRGDRL